MGLGHTPYVDELNHLVAASALAGGDPGVFGGGYEYTRARPFTWLVAASFTLFGESLAAARLPAVLAGTLLVIAVFLWVRTAVGRWEGWAAGILMLAAPQTIYHSQLARFYVFQALFVLGVAWCAWRLAAEPRWTSRRAVAFVVAGLLCAVGAMSMQISSLVGLAAIGAWLVGALAVGMVRRGVPPRALALRAAALGVTLVIAALWLRWSGTLARGLAAFNQPGLWAVDHADNLRFYHSHFLGHFPLLWAPFPLVVVLGLRRRPGLVSLWLSVFGLVFAVQSLAAWKADRYIFYVIPFFFAITAVILGPVLRQVFEELTTASRRALHALGAWRDAGGAGVRPGGDPRTASGTAEETRRLGGTARGAGRALPRVLAAGLLVAGLLFAAWGNSAFSYSARMMFESDASWPFDVMYRGEADWGAAGEALAGELDEVDIVVASTELKAGYFLGRHDLILSHNYLGRGDDGLPLPQYYPNDKTGLPAISRAETLGEVIACRRSGIVLVEDNHWRQPWSIDDELADVLETRTERIALDPGWRLHAFGWDHGPGHEPPPDGCEQVP